MAEDFREAMRKSLLESYKPRKEEGIRCAMCGKEGLPMSFHIAEKSYYNTTEFQEGFVPMSACGERTSGVFPICVECAPVCPKCGLPKPTTKILNFIKEKGAHAGCGMCEHIQTGLLAKALLKKLFGGK